MKNYFDKDSIKKLEIMNAGMGMEHRAKPFDFKNADDLKEAFKFSVCEYLDYKHYWSTLSQLDESFDESIEYYDPVNWMNMSIGEEIDDKLLKKAIKSISESEKVFYQLFQRSEEKCKKIFAIILKSEEKMQLEILNQYYKYDESLIDEVFDDERIFSLKYIHNMEKAYDSFLDYINEVLSELKPVN